MFFQEEAIEIEDDAVGCDSSLSSADITPASPIGSPEVSDAMVQPSTSGTNTDTGYPDSPVMRLESPNPEIQYIEVTPHDSSADVAFLNTGAQHAMEIMSEDETSHPVSPSKKAKHSNLSRKIYNLSVTPKPTKDGVTLFKGTCSFFPFQVEKSVLNVMCVPSAWRYSFLSVHDIIFNKP